MTEKVEKLIREIEELKLLEEEAAKLYRSIIPSISDLGDKKILEDIAQDEVRHARMAQAVVDILKS
ncbi:MAG: hypothetical protein COY66_04570 [Candidatus Kerfeldbacteria bacterium CG_4_10_14_0_8_um_filter_42_10]|uniref:Rubrerythrin n=1 Tax=Candidatus Kerfeldbacteria bacterium CG_4_10_14_0_8_um_filter_42_10 TaxID=2014248 RepID=A0A2M7RI96_9BACT|nr:MAG: hypothetical protein COY66_04570 [Candidatus Kerfeldbacteria bacterium CG_4_10_14_0_8_um_filter_42_10]